MLVAATESEASRPAPGAGVRSSRRRRRASILFALAVAAAAVFVVSLGLGPVPIAPGDIIRVLVRALGGDAGTVENGLVITQLRLPRALLALLAGAGLAVAGVAMQAYFRNPLAEPGVTGVASGAAVGAVTVIVLGASAIGAWVLPVAAFVGAVTVLVVIQLIVLASRDRSPVTVLLLGIAMNAFCGAVTGAIVANAEDSQTVRGALFWLQGDLTSASWRDFALVAVPAVLGIACLGGLARELNALLLGDETAESMGVSVTRVRAALLVLSAVIVGSVVAVTGVIGFVGLVAPHAVRLMLGSDHRFLLPGAAMLGGMFLVMADTVARLAPGGGAWQTGIVTALVGAPVFVVLVLRTRDVARRAA